MRHAVLARTPFRMMHAPTPAARSRMRLLASTALLSTALGAVVWAGGAAAQPAPTTLPRGGQVTAGQSTIASNGAAMTIVQGTPRAAIA